MKKISVYIETLGCQMNVADSERAAARLRAAGYEMTGLADGADVVLFNTCSVRARAEQKVFNRIGQVRHARPQREPIFGVMGCVAQLEGERLFGDAPSIRFVVGTRATDRLPAVLERVYAGERLVIDLGERREGEQRDVSPAERARPHTAFVPIIEGCNKFCSYCIVPFARGRERSRPAHEVVDEVLQLRAAGFREVHLIGQNVNSYRPVTNTGLEAFAGATPFARLLRAVAATNLERIKFTTSFPRDFHTDIIAAIDEHPNLCNWVHLPVQSGSDAILRSMRRGYKVDDYLRRIDSIKNAVGRRIALTSDIIVGFPGETSEDFAATLRLVERCRYDGLYIFKYSERARTKAALLADDVSADEKKSRFMVLEQLQQTIQRDIYQSYVDSSVSVLVERHSARSENNMMGHSTCHKVVNFSGGKEGAHLQGCVVDVTVTEAKENSLFGRFNGSSIANSKS